MLKYFFKENNSVIKNNNQPNNKICYFKYGNEHKKRDFSKNMYSFIRLSLNPSSNNINPLT